MHYRKWQVVEKDYMMTMIDDSIKRMSLIKYRETINKVVTKSTKKTNMTVP
jgi:hypothetical protein